MGVIIVGKILVGLIVVVGSCGTSNVVLRMIDL